jgi:4'-phosphopantetheinyl transferase
MLYWMMQNLALVPQGDFWLSERERATAANFRFSKRLNDWRLGRWTVKQAVAAHPVFKRSIAALSDIEIVAAPDGAPELIIAGGRGLSAVSLSHSEGVGFCVLGPAEHPLGCDLEFVQTHESDFFQDYFTHEEMSWLSHASPDRRAALSILIWSAKESALKALRQGLRRDTRSVSITSIAPGQQDMWGTYEARCLESARTFHGWWREREGFIQTVVSTLATVPPNKMEVVGERRTKPAGC